jgi:hypothetical protein
MTGAGARRGASVVEALVAAALAGMAFAGLAAVGGLAAGGLRLARDTSVALALGLERLETLRLAGDGDGADSVAAGGTVYARRWRVEGGRGSPRRLAVDVAWGGREVSLSTEALP